MDRAEHVCSARVVQTSTGEYAAAFGLRVDDDDLHKMAKAIGIGAQKARVRWPRHARHKGAIRKLLPIVWNTKPSRLRLQTNITKQMKVRSGRWPLSPTCSAVAIFFLFATLPCCGPSIASADCREDPRTVG
jgi:hypothetical protein